MEHETEANAAGFYRNPAFDKEETNFGNLSEVEKRAKAAKNGKTRTKHPVLPRAEIQRLRQWLRLLFYPAVQFRGRSCSFNLIYILIFILQLIKIILVTIQMFNFGDDRRSFSSIVNRGHLVLRHLLLQHWDSTWESLPYPPSRGDFAVYSIDDMKSRINFAVSQYYNSETDAMGFYIRKYSDNMTITAKFFDFPGFNDTGGQSSLNVFEMSFPVEHGLQENKNQTTGEPYYLYDIDEEFEYWNISQPFKKLLSITLTFSIHSVRVYYEDLTARCLHVQGWVTFVDDTNNGQVLVDLETLTSRLTCDSIGYNVEDADLQKSSHSLGEGVIAMCCLSLIVTVVMMALGVLGCVRTKQYMKKNYKAFYRPVDDREVDLPFSEYLGFVKVWDFITIVSDCFTLYATNWIVHGDEDATWVIETLDKYAVILSVGCFGTWVALLRFFKFHNKFFLLFATLYRALIDVFAYLICVAILFVGFLASGFVVMAPYHVKFSTTDWSAETLLSVVNGDEMFATMNILEVKKTGGPWVKRFSRFYFAAYIAVFTIVVLNLLVAIFMSAYEAVREYYSLQPEDRDLHPVERAIKNFLTSSQSDQKQSMAFRSSLYDIMTSDGAQINELTTLREQLGKLIKVDVDEKDVYVFRPRTLQAFVTEGSSEEAYRLRCFSFKCFFYFFPRNID